MRKTRKKGQFIVQVTDSSVKAIQCAAGKPNISNAAFAIFPEPPDTLKLSELVLSTLKKIGYSHQPILLSLPRSQVTLRYIKIPSQQPEEIEKIVHLQAPRYLPYPAEELICGFQALSTDNDGFTHVNLVVAHKQTIERQLAMLAGFGTESYSLFVSSFGLAEFYHFNSGEEKETVLCIDLELPSVEIAIIRGDKLLYSRAVRIPRGDNWQRQLAEEINKTREAYKKEVQGTEPKKIVFLRPSLESNELLESLRAESGLLVDTLSFPQKITATAEASKIISGAEVSFSSLLGFALKRPPETLNILPADKKNTLKGRRLVQEHMRIAGSIAGIVLIVAIGTAKNLDNKHKHLIRLRQELAKVEKDALPLTELDRRFTLLEGHLHKRPLVLDLLHELYKIIPAQISLINFSFEEDKEITVRGQTQQLNNVFAFVTLIEKSDVYRGYDTKVRYATQKKTLSGEMVDFEIACTKK